MNGKMIVSKPLYVALAQRKEDRKARLQVCLCYNLKQELTISYSHCILNFHFLAF